MTVTATQIKFDSPNYWSAVKLREEVLRKPLGLTLTPADIADDSAGHHFCALDGSEVVACAILFPQAAGAARLRQMAVAPGLHRQGIGSALLRFVEAWAREHAIGTITLHARLPAVPFYEQHGYVVDGEVFTEVTIPHRHMRKPLGLEHR